MKTIQVTIALLPGERCLVENYRSKHKPWEPGTVDDTEVGFRDEGTYYVLYRVVLDRCVISRRGFEKRLFLHVGNNQILPISNPAPEQ